MGFSGIGIALQDTRHFKTGLPKGVDDLFANFEGFGTDGRSNAGFHETRIGSIFIHEDANSFPGNPQYSSPPTGMNGSYSLHIGSIQQDRDTIGCRDSDANFRHIRHQGIYTMHIKLLFFQWKGKKRRFDRTDLRPMNLKRREDTFGWYPDCIRKKFPVRSDSFRIVPTVFARVKGCIRTFAHSSLTGCHKMRDVAILA